MARSDEYLRELFKKAQLKLLYSAVQRGAPCSLAVALPLVGIDASLPVVEVAQTVFAPCKSCKLAVITFPAALSQTKQHLATAAGFDAGLLKVRMYALRPLSMM